MPDCLPIVPNSVAARQERLRVVNVAGTGHCGSTLLAFLLDSHPEIATVGESSLSRNTQRRTGGQSAHCSCGALLSTCAFWIQVFEAVRRQGFEMSASLWANDYRYTNPLLHKLLTTYHADRSRRLVQSAIARLVPAHGSRLREVSNAHVAFVRTVLDLKGANVFLDTTKNLVRLDGLLHIDDLDVKILRITRDVRAFAHSYRNRMGGNVQTAARQWRAYQIGISDLAARLSTEKLFTLKYEDLCSDSRRWLQQLYRFFGVAVLEPPTRIRPDEHHIIGNAMRMKEPFTVSLDDKWRSVLAKADESAVLAIAGDINQSLGYE